VTISASTNFEFNVGEICKLAYRNAGLLSPYQGVSDPLAGAARDALQLVVNASQAKGLFARVVEFTNVTLASGTSRYTLATSILDVAGDGAFIPVGQSLTAASGEMPVASMQRDEWQGLSAKNVTSRPTRYYAHKTASAVELRLWPTPSSTEDGATVRFQTHRFRADVRDAAATVDYERYWTQYLVLALAAELSRQNSMPMERVLELKASAREALEECKAQSKQRGPEQLTVSCRTGWANR
jgi:hypothetical protein